MKVVILALVVIGILLAIASGVWVAIALVKAISRQGPAPATNCRPNTKSGDDDRQI